MTDSTGTTLEIILNAELASLLRQHGLEAEAEQSIHVRRRRHQVDVLVELGDHAVAIEAEFAPARTDAEQRLPPEPLRWRGLAVSSVFAMTYPESLKGIPESRARTELACCDSLEFVQVSEHDIGIVFGDVPDVPFAKRIRGSVATIAECLHNYWIRHAAGGPPSKRRSA